MSRLEAKYLQTLRRKVDFLAHRIANQPGRRGESYDRAELAALRWALDELTEFIAETEPLDFPGHGRN